MGDARRVRLRLPRARAVALHTRFGLLYGLGHARERTGDAGGSARNPLWTGEVSVCARVFGLVWLCPRRVSVEPFQGVTQVPCDRAW